MCYDHEELESRKKHKPGNNAIDTATTMGIERLTEEQYRTLQKLGDFDMKTSSWVQTPSDIRELGVALFLQLSLRARLLVPQFYYTARSFHGSLRV